MSIGRSFDDINERGEIAPKFTPPIIRFEEDSVLDKEATVKAGRNIYKTAHFVKIKPSDADRTIEIVKRSEKWLRETEEKPLYTQNYYQGVLFGQFAREMYKAWCNNQDGPVEGTHLKEWGLVTKAQAATLCEAGVNTVERLAELSDVGIRQFGRSFYELRNKAKTWLVAANSNNTTEAIEALKEENTKLKEVANDLVNRVNELVSIVNSFDPKSKVKPTSLNVDDFSAGLLTEDLLKVKKPATKKKTTKKKAKKKVTKKRVARKTKPVLSCDLTEG